MKKVLTFLMIIFAITFVYAQDEIVVEQVETQVEQVGTTVDKVETQVLEIETQVSEMQITNPFTYGVKGGVSLNHFLGDLPLDITPQVYFGFTGGVFGNYQFTDKFSLRAELLYTRKGSNFDEFDFIPETIQLAQLLSLDMFIKTDWIEIPLLGMYHVNDDFTLFGGPYIGFYLDGKVKAEPSIAGILSIDWEYDIDADNLRLPDYGIIIGGAYNISEKVAVQGRWEYGIQDLADDVIVNFLDDDLIVINNSSFQLQLDITI